MRDAQARPRLCRSESSTSTMKGTRLEDLVRPRRDGAPGLGVRAVDLGQQGRQHRRTGRHLDHLDDCARGQRQVLQPLAQVERDLVAGAVALALGRRLTCRSPSSGAVAQVVVPHQPIEIERCRRCRHRPGSSELPASCRADSALENRTRSVSSRLAPSGRSTTTDSSDLLSKGSSFTVTALGRRTARRRRASPPRRRSGTSRRAGACVRSASRRRR